jgi:hypothetical protein
MRWILLRVVTVEFQSPDGRTLSGVSFSAPVEICFQLTQEQWQAYTKEPDSFRVQYYAELMSPPRWEMLPPSTYPDRLQLCGQTHDLSVFGLAVQVQPGIPVTGLIAALPPAAANQPAQAHDRRGTNNSSGASALQVIPSAAATQIPPTQLRPTDPPPAEPDVTEPSPAIPAVTDEQKKEEKAQDKQQKEEEKAQDKQLKEEEKAQDKQQKEEEKARDKQLKEEEKANGKDKKDKEK